MCPLNIWAEYNWGKLGFTQNGLSIILKLGFKVIVNKALNPVKSQDSRLKKGLSVVLVAFVGHLAPYEACGLRFVSV